MCCSLKKFKSSALFGGDNADDIACMANVRHKFVDVFASQSNAIAEDTIRRIAELYAVDKDARGKLPNKRIASRQAPPQQHNSPLTSSTARLQRTGTTGAVQCAQMHLKKSQQADLEASSSPSSVAV